MMVLSASNPLDRLTEVLKPTPSGMGSENHAKPSGLLDSLSELASPAWKVCSGGRPVLAGDSSGSGMWHEGSAEAVLLLRSYYKAGRWKNLEKQVVTAILQDAA